MSNPRRLRGYTEGISAQKAPIAFQAMKLRRTILEAGDAREGTARTAAQIF
jgi:hypothetical protein